MQRESKVPRTILERLAFLEATNNRLHRMFHMVIAAIAATIGLQALYAIQNASTATAGETPRPPDKIQARAFEVVDGTGRVWASLFADHDFPKLQMNDRKGQKQLVMDSLGLTIFDRNEERVQLGLFRKGSAPKLEARLEFRGEGGKRPLSLNADWSDDPSLMMFDSNDKLRLLLNVMNGEPSIDLRDANGETRWKKP